MLVGKQISGLFLLFSSKRVCCHCGARHNAEMGLYGTDYRCIEKLSIKRDHSVFILLRNIFVHLQNLRHFNMLMIHSTSVSASRMLMIR